MYALIRKGKEFSLKAQIVQDFLQGISICLPLHAPVTDEHCARKVLEEDPFYQSDLTLTRTPVSFECVWQLL